MSLKAFGGVAAFIRKEKFRGVIDIVVKMEICLICNPISVKKWVLFLPPSL